MKLTRNQKSKENRKGIRKLNKLKMTFGILFVMTFISVISLLGIKQGYFTIPNSLAETTKTDWGSWASTNSIGVIYATDVQLLYESGSEVTGVVNLECIYTWDSIVLQRNEALAGGSTTWGYDILELDTTEWDPDGSTYVINSTDQASINAKTNNRVSATASGLSINAIYLNPDQVYAKVSKSFLTQNELVPVNDSGANGWTKMSTGATFDTLMNTAGVSEGDEFYIYLYVDSYSISYTDSVVRVYHMQAYNTCDVATDVTLTTTSGVTFDKSSELSSSLTDASLSTNTPVYSTDFLKFNFSNSADSDLSSNVEIRYYISSEFETNTTTSDLTKISPGVPTGYGSGNGNFYVYVQLVDTTGVYEDSAIRVYKIEEKNNADITISADIEGDAGATTADAGDTVVLTADPDSIIFYRDDGESITLSATSSGPTTTGGNLNTSTNPIYFVEDTTYNYVQYRGSWYQVDKEVKYYDPTSKITVPESIRTDGEYAIYGFAIAENQIDNSWAEISTPSKITTYKVELGESVDTVSITAKDSSGVELPTTSNGNIIIEAGDVIWLEFDTDKAATETANWEIFYTFSQSTPVVKTTVSSGGEYVTAPSNTVTKKYDAATGIVVTDADIVDKTSLYITAMGVSYDAGTGNKLLNNSDITTALYYFDDVEVVLDSITITPTTSDTELTEVKEGDFIRLYVEPYVDDDGNTSTTSPTIFYTIDGSEPKVNQVGDGEGNVILEPDSSTTTLEYTGTFQVPAATSTLFTVTAVLSQAGYTDSQIYRFTYQYPEAVSVPYAVPSSGTVVENTTVTLSCATEDVIIYYEIAYGGSEPSEPTSASNVYVEDNPIIINDQTWIKAYALGENGSSNVVSFQYTLAGKLSVPVPSISSGAVVSSGTLITLTAGDTGTIYYTTDGSDPSDTENTSALVGSTVILSGDPGTAINVKTCSMGTNYSSSDIGFYSYTISSFEGGVFTDIESESTVENGSSIGLYTDVTNGTIYYTTDGTMPTSASASGSSVTVSGESGGTFNIKAMALSTGATQTTSAATFTYNLMSKLKSVVADVPTGAIFTEAGSVALSAEIGTIYYTLDGADPTITSSIYSEAIEIDETTTIKAFAVEDEYEDSDIKEFVYTFADQVARPNASVATGEIAVNEEVSFTTTTAGATIYYTTNGTEPNLLDKDSLQLYTGPITVTKATTFSVMAVKEGMENSDVLTCRYTVREPVVEEVESVAQSTAEETSTSGRLQSRSTFSDTSGPSFTDIVLKNITYGIVLSGDYGTMNEGASLQVEKIYTSAVSSNMVKQRLGEDYDFVANYDITLLLAGEEIQPDGEIEIGLPIPADYENAMIYVVHTADDGTMEIYDTRRSNGVAYAMTSHLSSYGIVAPVIVEEVINYTWLIIVSAVGTLGLIIIGTILIRRVRKHKKEEEYS